MFQLIAHLLKSLLSDRTALAMENLALRQQLAVYEKTIRRPKLTNRDRFFWVLLRKFCSGWEKFLLIVQPETVVKWHRMGFRLFWRWKSKRRGRPKVPRQIRNLIRLMSRENRTWGAPRIVAELALLGYDLAESTVARYMIKHSNFPSSTWRTYFQYYNNCRTHQSLEGNSPDPREVEPSEKGRIISIPQVAGLHHVYRRAA